MVENVVPPGGGNVVVGGVNGMEDFVSAITASNTGITTDTLFAMLVDVAPVVIVGFMVGFGLYLLRRALRGAQKGKAKV